MDFYQLSHIIDFFKCFQQTRWVYYLHWDHSTWYLQITKCLFHPSHFQNILKDTDSIPGPLDPVQPAKPFTLDTLDGPVKFPSKLLPNTSNTPIIVHTFNNHSAFLECMWTNGDSLESLVMNSTDNVALYIYTYWRRWVCWCSVDERTD